MDFAPKDGKRVPLFGAFKFFNIFLVILGLGSLGVGIWLNAERDVKAVIFVFGASSSGNILIAGTALCMAAGIILIGVAAIAFVALRRQSRGLLSLYCALLLVVMIMELIAGFMALGFREEIYRYALSNMQNQVQNDYEFSNKVGKAWNRVQVRRRCCGADSPEDYRCSEWWYSQEDNSGFSCPNNYYPALEQVPPSCCVLEMNQERDVDNVDPQNPIPKNKKRCNEEAAGNMYVGSSNVRSRGCFAAIQDVVFEYIYVILGIGIGIGVIQVISVVLGFLVRGKVTALNQ